jgi:hypothetical protein
MTLYKYRRLLKRIHHTKGFVASVKTQCSTQVEVKFYVVFVLTNARVTPRTSDLLQYSGFRIIGPKYNDQLKKSISKLFSGIKNYKLRKALTVE